MYGRHFLFVPGPTHLPERVIRAMARSLEDHRSSVFPELTRGLLTDLKSVFGTTAGRPFIFPGTGTSGWEIALTNMLSPGDTVLAVRNGQFSHLFAQAATNLGFNVRTIDVEWGEAVPVEQVADALRADGEQQIRAVLVVHNETATGVRSDIAGVRAALDSTAHDALLLVDGVSSIGCMEFLFDAWGVDVAVAGTQKGLMLPAGLAIIAVSEKGLAASESARAPRSVFNLQAMAAQNDEGYFPYTPPLSILFGLREALDIFAEEGLENVFARHARLGAGARAAVAAWDLQLCARDPQAYSDSLSTVMLPAEYDARKVIDIAFRRWNLSLGGGLARLAGRAFRIGHMGDVNELMLLGALGGVELAMMDAGVPITAGSGVSAAQLVFSESTPRPADA
ncbi:MAG TPA: aminotransferase class V-fold PLP-dependent enzyme [Gemmatimonadales bacterium]|nr:aminotransferase class V-fold PLP-dependent enzyme [Gemmatimonadales bacterium]